MDDDRGIDVAILIFLFFLLFIISGAISILEDEEYNYEIAYTDKKLFMYDDNQEIRIVNCPEMKIVKELSNGTSVMFFCEQNSLVEFEANARMIDRILVTFGKMENHIWTTDEPSKLMFDFNKE